MRTSASRSCTQSQDQADRASLPDRNCKLSSPATKASRPPRIRRPIAPRAVTARQQISKSQPRTRRPVPRSGLRSHHINKHGITLGFHPRRSHANSETRNPNTLGLGSSQIASLIAIFVLRRPHRALAARLQRDANCKNLASRRRISSVGSPWLPPVGCIPSEVINKGSGCHLFRLEDAKSLFLKSWVALSHGILSSYNPQMEGIMASGAARPPSNQNLGVVRDFRNKL